MKVLKHTEGRLVVKMDMEYKNSWTFEDGTKISLQRKYDCFDNRYTQPINAIVISADNIPEGSEVLLHHNAQHQTNQIFSYQPLSGDVEASDIKYLSVGIDEAFVYREKDSTEWKPLPGYDFALRVFRPYFGPLQGIEPELLKNTMLITTGEYKGLICHTLKYTDYELIFQDLNGREARVIRLRTNGCARTKREEEIVCINHKLTDEYNAGKIYAGLTKSDCKPKNELTYA